MTRYVTYPAGRSLRRERTSGPPPARPPCPDPFGFASPTARRARPRAARRGRGDRGVAARQMRSDITRRRRQPRRVRTSLLSASTWAHPYGAIPAPAPPLGFSLFGSIRPLVLPRGLHACAAWPSIGTPRDFRYGVRAEAPEPPSGVRSRSRSRRRTRPSGKARVPYRYSRGARTRIARWDKHKRLPRVARAACVRAAAASGTGHVRRATARAPTRWRAARGSLTSTRSLPSMPARGGGRDTIVPRGARHDAQGARQAGRTLLAAGRRSRLPVPVRAERQADAACARQSMEGW